jgi:hypothetical protein
MSNAVLPVLKQCATKYRRGRYIETSLVLKDYEKLPYKSRTLKESVYLRCDDLATYVNPINKKPFQALGRELGCQIHIIYRHNVSQLRSL